MPIIEISSLTHPGVDVFCMLTEAQLRQRIELGKGVFIAESPNVISRALDAGYEPLALMCERKPLAVLLTLSSVVVMCPFIRVIESCWLR